MMQATARFFAWKSFSGLEFLYHLKLKTHRQNKGNGKYPQPLHQMNEKLNHVHIKLECFPITQNNGSRLRSFIKINSICATAEKRRKQERKTVATNRWILYISKIGVGCVLFVLTGVR